MSVWDRIVHAYRALQTEFARAAERQRRLNEFRKVVAAAVADGVVTLDEFDALREAQRQLGLTDADVQAIRGEVIRQALQAATEDKRLSPEEERSLQQLAEYFDLPADQIPANREQLDRYRLLYQLEHEPLPVVMVPGLVLRRGETPHWSEPGELLEERVINRRYEGGSSGFSFRIAKGVRYRVGGHRGRIVTETGLVPISRGDLVLTNRRIVFRGDRRSVAAEWTKVIDVSLYLDGIKVSVTNRAKPVLIRFADSRNAEIVGVVVSRLINEA